MAPRERSRSRPTLSDVARLAGVSATTASYILNDRSLEMRISSDAQHRVREAAAALSYQPNRSARSLRTARTKTIGLVSDHIASGHFASPMLSGAIAAARDQDHVLLIAETQGDRSLEERLIAEMLARQVDGFVYATLTAREVTLPRLLEGESVVLLNCFESPATRPSVMPDDFEGGRQAAALLVDSGAATRVLVVGQDPDLHTIAGPRRLAGITEQLLAAGACMAGVLPCAWDVVPAFHAVDDWLGRGEQASGLVCLNDRIAMGAYQAMSAHGLRIPTDIAVVSFDGSDLARWQRPAVTSIDLPFTDLGAAAVRLLMGLEPIPPNGVLLLPMGVVSGGSLPEAERSVDTDGPGH